MYASAQRENKTSTSRVDPVRFGTRSAARTPPGPPIAPIATPSHLLALQCKMQNRPVPNVHEATPRTGSLPNGLRAGIEGLSGMPMDDVRVHYNSDKPLQLQAFAFTQGNEIHVAPGQEEHLPHEAWHAVQQKQKRVPTTAQLKGVGINDNKALELEATEMGNAAARGSRSATHKPDRTTEAGQTATAANPSAPVVQRFGVKDFFSAAGKVAGNVLLGPLWDAGKAIKRRVQGGNLFLGSSDYRRYGRRYPQGVAPAKAGEYKDKTVLTNAYGGLWWGRLGRALNLCSSFAGDVAKYAGWATGISGLIIAATGGAAAPVLGGATALLGTITAGALALKFAISGTLNAWLARRIDKRTPNPPPKGAVASVTSTATPEMLDEERHTRSDYGRALVASTAFTGINMGAEMIGGANFKEAWLTTTGQMESSSAAPEVAAAIGGEMALEGGDTIAEETEWEPIKPFAPNQRPMHTWGLHWVNPFYWVVRTWSNFVNLLKKIWNSFRPESTHRATKEGAFFKVGNQRDNKEGWGLTATKFGVGTLLGAAGGVLGAGLGAAAGAVGGFFRGMMSGAQAGWAAGKNSMQNKGRWLAALGGGLAGLGLGAGLGTVAGAGAGMLLGATALGSSGWDLGHGRNPHTIAKIDAMLDGLVGFAKMGTGAMDELKAALSKCAGQ